MRTGDRKPLYRHIDVALLRAAAAPLTSAVDRWPDLTDTDACRQWLEQMWSRPDLADAVRQASPSLGEGVDAIRAGRPVGDKQIRSATCPPRVTCCAASAAPPPSACSPGWPR